MEMPARWEWKDAHGWVGYSPDVCQHLDSARYRGLLETTIMVDGSRWYVVNLRTLRQRNPMTNFEREVRRLEVERTSPQARMIEVAKTECTDDALRLQLDCPICTEEFDKSREAFKLNKCKGGLTHAFHAECIQAWFATGNGRCPVCRASCCITIGTQPNGSMRNRLENAALPGFPASSRTRVITYFFPDGMQDSEHPHPGLPFSGTSRTAFLPSPEGDRHFRGLEIAFARRLVFRVGQSITTGRDNCVVWGGIHHKTCRSPGDFGYPDPAYLDALMQELLANGITAEDIDA